VFARSANDAFCNPRSKEDFMKHFCQKTRDFVSLPGTRTRDLMQEKANLRDEKSLFCSQWRKILVLPWDTKRPFVGAQLLSVKKFIFWYQLQKLLFCNWERKRVFFRVGILDRAERGAAASGEVQN
jgi:hypothetical protein